MDDFLPVEIVEQSRRQHTEISTTLPHTCAGRRERTPARQEYVLRLV